MFMFKSSQAKVLGIEQSLIEVDGSLIWKSSKK
jgi:hypothetical protein